MNTNRVLSHTEIVLEQEAEEGVMKVTEEFISDLRALAKRQKLESSAETFAKACGDKGKKIVELSLEENQINKIADTLEVLEEE
jgi:hypothetical protein